MGIETVSSSDVKVLCKGGPRWKQTQTLIASHSGWLFRDRVEEQRRQSFYGEQPVQNSSRECSYITYETEAEETLVNEKFACSL